MSYATWTNNDTTGKYYYSYPSTCVGGSYQYQGNLPRRYESVYSWRGGVEYMRIGSKRRKVAHCFRVAKYHVLTDPSTDFWCHPSASKKIRGQDMIFAIFRGRHADWVYGLNPASYEGSSFPVYGYPAHDEIGEKLRDMVCADMYTKLHEPRFDSLVFLAELEETLTSVKDLFLNVVKGLTSVRKSYQNLKHVVLNSEELWLWYRYFLVPAMLDAEQLINALPANWGGSYIDRVQDGMSKKTTHLSGTVYSHGWWNSTTIEMPWQEEITTSAGGAMDILRRFDPHEWGISAWDLQRAIWERIPYSFIVDWWINVGDWLTTLRDVEIDYAQSYATYAIESDLQFSTGPYVTSSHPARCSTLVIDRIIDLEPPSHPQVNREWNSILHTIDSISLAAGTIKRVFALSGKLRRH